MNPPTGRHSLITYVLQQLLIPNIDPSWICLQNLGVRTGIQKVRIPDLCVVSRVALSELLSESAVFQIPPFLVVEIVSQELIQRDYRYKRSEYAALGIPEYWIVDPLQNKVTVLLWEEGLYEETVFEKSDRLSSQILPELRVTVEKILCL